MKPKYITTAAAAALAGVTKETIQNLCRGGNLTYQMKGHQYMVSKEEVEKYKATITEIHQATQDIELLNVQIKNDREELADRKERLRLRLISMGMFPKRIEAITQTLVAAIEHFQNHEADDAKNILEERDIKFMMDCLQGKSVDEISIETHLSKQRVTQIWMKALRRYAFTRNEIARRDATIKELEQIIASKNEEIATLKGIKLPSETEKIARILDSQINEDLTIRCYNCLKWADIYTYRDLVKYTRADMLRFRNFGKRSLTELDELLASKGLAFGMDTSQYPSLK